MINKSGTKNLILYKKHKEVELMKKSLKTLIIMVTVFALILGSIATVAAVPYYNLDTGKEYTAEMLRPGSPDREELKALAPDKIGINIFGKVYSYNGLIAKLAEIFGIGGIGGIQDFFGDEENLKEFEVELPDFEVIEISAINTSVANNVKGIKGERTKIEPDNVVVMGTTAELKALAVDAQGNPVSGAPVTFTVTGAETESPREFNADAKFTNGLSTFSVNTNANGVAIAKLRVDIQNRRNNVRDLRDYAFKKGAATEVSYTVSHSGTDVTQDDTVAFATIREGFFKDARYDNYYRFLNDEELFPSVKVEPYYGGIDYAGFETFWVYPFSQEDGANLAANVLYAAANQVSIRDGAKNRLAVEAPYIGLYIKNTQFTARKNTEHGAKTFPLSYSIGPDLQPNQIDIYKVPHEIPNSVNYATLNFSELSLSPGSAVSVYFVPKGGSAPEKAYTANSNAYLDVNGMFIGGGKWVKTFYAKPAAFYHWDDEESMHGTQSLTDTDFGVQIPANFNAGDVYVVLSTPGQIDPATDNGYTLKSIVMNYGASNTPTCDFDEASLHEYMTWKQIELEYTEWYNMPPRMVRDLWDADPCNERWEIEDGWTYKYKVPVYPQVGNAVVCAFDGNNKVQMAWSVPTTNAFDYSGINQNEIIFRYGYNFGQEPGWYRTSSSPGWTPVHGGRIVWPLAMDAAFESVGEIVSQKDGVAIIDSTKTGYTALCGTLSLPCFNEDLLNLLADKYYAFAQWTPAYVTGEIPEPEKKICITEQQYALAGQRVEIEAKLTDVNGNWVESAGVPVYFYVSADEGTRNHDITVFDFTYDVQAGQYERYRVYTDAYGEAKLTISAADVAAAIVQAEAIGYQVHLKTPAGDLNKKCDGLTQINFGRARFEYIPMNNNFEPVATDINQSKVVVGNQQNFGLMSFIDWPGNWTSRVPNLPVPFTVQWNEEGEDALLYTIYDCDCGVAPEHLWVCNVPFDVTVQSGTVGSVTQVEPTTSTDENLKDKNGNRHGITHWTAVSDKTGLQIINIKSSPDYRDWASLKFKSDSGVDVVKAGSGAPAGLNKLNIPVQWMPTIATARITTPYTTYAEQYTSVPVTVCVKDAFGNPLEDIRVTFGLNYQSASFGDAVFEESDNIEYIDQTGANGCITVHVIDGVPGERDQVTVDVFNERTGTLIQVDQDGALRDRGHQVIDWEEALPQTIVDYVAAAAEAYEFEDVPTKIVGVGGNNNNEPYVKGEIGGQVGDFINDLGSAGSEVTYTVNTVEFKARDFYQSNGSYKFTITFEKDGKSVTTDEITVGVVRL